MSRYRAVAILEDGTNEITTADQKTSVYKNVKQFREAMLKNYKGIRLEYLGIEEIIVDRIGYADKEQPPPYR